MLKTVLLRGGLIISISLSLLILPQGTMAANKGNKLVGVSKASNLIGKKVTNLEGENLGDIKDLVINWRDGGIVAYAVLSFGGFMGVGDKLFAVPWEVLILSPDKEHFILNIEKERLKQAPGFDKNNWPDMTSQDWEQVVYRFYEVRPQGKANQDKANRTAPLSEIGQ
jgi:sporulation protein YlmC with PRC-barrel domain